MEEDEEKFIKEVNIDRARNMTALPIALIILNILTYILPLIGGELDIGLIFEGISLISLLISRYCMKYYDLDKAKIFNICAIASIGWILVYDLITYFMVATDALDLIMYGYDFYAYEFLLILYIMILFQINRILLKAENPTKYKEDTDWFYEKYEKK